MSTSGEPLRFEDYLVSRGAALQRYAYVLTGTTADAEDLVQAALMRAYRQWRRVGRMAAPHAYVRQILTRCFLDNHRRRSAGERLVAEIPDVPDPTDHAARVADLDAMIRALDHLTPQQRAVLVLRHLLDLSDEQIAAELGCSAVTVRTHASRGLQHLRTLLTYPDLEIDHEPRR